MSHMRKLRIIVALSVAAVAVTLAPTAQAAESQVCNQARSGHTGPYVATDGDPSTPARHQSTLGVLGSGKGLTRAAERSPALSVCVIPAPKTGNDGGGSTVIVVSSIEA